MASGGRGGPASEDERFPGVGQGRIAFGLRAAEAEAHQLKLAQSVVDVRAGEVLTTRLSERADPLIADVERVEIDALVPTRDLLVEEFGAPRDVLLGCEEHWRSLLAVIVPCGTVSTIYSIAPLYRKVKLGEGECTSGDN